MLCHAPIGNQLLSLLLDEDSARLAPELARIELPRGYVLAEPDQPITEIIFPEDGVASIVAVSAEGTKVEAGLFGREGLGPLNPLMGSDRTPNHVFMQLPGSGWRITARALGTAMDASVPLRTLVLRYAHTLSLQMSYTALSNAMHPVEERLARWILMCHDRQVGDELELTHGFIAIMLGVRRPSVTTSLHVLEGNGFIRCERGWIIVRDREKLEMFAADAYGKPEAEYRRLLI